MCRSLAFLVVVLLICYTQVDGQEDPNLVGYWNFDDGTATDLSGNSNNGMFMGNAGLNNDPNWTLGQTGMSLDLNYQNSNTDWVEIPHSDGLNITHEITILLWIRPDDIENWDGLVCKGTTKSPWALRFNLGHGLRFTTNTGFNLDDPADPNYAPGAVGTGDRQSVFEVPEVDESQGIDWSFVGVVSDTKSLRFILNLEEEMLPATYIFAESDEPLALGSYLPDDNYFNGLMDEVRIYNRALSIREIIAISGLAEKPFEPEPADGAVGVISNELTWGRIEGTDKLYLGTSQDSLELVSEDVGGSYTIKDSVSGQTYYWRVDVVTTNGTVTGDVWSFTMTEEGASGPTPSDNADFVDVDGLSLSWLPVLGATSFDVYFGTAPDALELLGQVTENSYENPGMTLVSETLYYWRVDTVKEDKVITGPVWSFKTMPVFAVEDALAAWYKFELGEGTTAVDWTRKGNEGVLVGDTKWITEGYSGGALEFDGEADYVEIPRVVQDDWTIMLWLHTDDLGQSWPGRLGTVGRVRNGVGLIDGDAGGPAENFALTLNGDRIVAGCTAEGQGDGGALASTARISDIEWSHITWTRVAETGEMALFIDGIPDNSGQNDKWIGTKDAQDFIWLGGLQFANRHFYFKGQLDEIKFFTRVLDEAEIKEEMRPDKRLAFLPQPVPGAVLDQEAPVILAWKPGDGATAHNIYLGTSENEMSLVGPAQILNEYEAGLLEPATYFWQIGEIQADGAEVRGELWSFVVADYLVIDDFESYDANDNQIWFTWHDGLGFGLPGTPDFSAGNGTGSAVGDETTASYTEETIVNGGSQSMPLQYINDGSTGKALFSEVGRTFDSAQDWTRKDSKELSLWFRGYPASSSSFTEGPAGTYTMITRSDDIYGTSDSFHYVYKQLSGPGSIIVKVESITETSPSAKAGVMIRETLTPDSKFAMVVARPNGSIRFRRREQTAEDSINSADNNLAIPHWVKLERDFSGLFTASHSTDGINFVPVDDASLGTSAVIQMSTDVYIGLALSSNNPEETCNAVFSDVSTTGTVTGQWQSQDIGIVTNDSEPMYLAITDSTGTQAVVYHDDPDAARIDTWTEWIVLLQDFADQGIVLADVDKIAIGLGAKGNITIPGGSGKMYYDDIRLYRSRDITDQQMP